MVKIIITGVDGSETAALASSTAARIANAFGATLHVVSAYDVNTAQAFSRDPRRLVAKAEAAISENEDHAVRTTNEMGELLTKEYPALQIHTHAIEGNPADVLLYQAEQLNADLIVVGNKRVQGPGRILGSVARSVAAEAKCDLYVVNTHQ